MEHNLSTLIISFNVQLSPTLIKNINEYVESGEPGLAIEELCNYIYEYDVEPNPSQLDMIIKISEHYSIDKKYHVFIGKKPPYPDLRTKEQLSLEKNFYKPSIQKVHFFVRNNQKLLAIKMYREITNCDLETANKYINNIN